MATSKSKKRRSPLQVAYSNLSKVKALQCAGRAKATDVNKAKKTYVERAVKAGQSKTEATAKANRVLRKACPK